MVEVFVLQCICDRVVGYLMKAEKAERCWVIFLVSCDFGGKKEELIPSGRGYATSEGVAAAFRSCS